MSVVMEWPGVAAAAGPVLSRVPLLPVRGPSALVPGTTLRLPVLTVVAHLPAGQRCPDCAGTGVQLMTEVLESCFCMDPNPGQAA